MSDFDDMKIISTYTTKEAVTDGYLVRVAATESQEAGIKFPVYLTRAVWDKYVEVPAGMESEQNLSGRLWDILWMFRIAAKSTPGQLLLFRLNCRLPDKGDWFLQFGPHDILCLKLYTKKVHPLRVPVPSFKDFPGLYSLCSVSSSSSLTAPPCLH